MEGSWKAPLLLVDGDEIIIPPISPIPSVKEDMPDVDLEEAGVPANVSNSLKPSECLLAIRN
jgi:hypothetical protein